MDKIKTIKKTNWRLIVDYEGELLKDLEAKKGELEIVGCGGSRVILEVDGKDVSDLITDKRRKKIRRIVDEAMSYINSDFEMEWTK